MTRGISWRQHWMLKSIGGHPEESVVAWRDIDQGHTGTQESAPDYFGARASWNREQTLRRALKSLERRGLVELGRYVFDNDPRGIYNWTVTDPDRHVPGVSRIMTGASLTPAGRAVAARPINWPERKVAEGG